MTPAIDPQAALTAGKTITAPKPTANAVAAKKAAQQFEGVFVSEFLGSMFEGVSTDGPFGGGQGEAMFRSLMLDEYGKQIANRGGLGIASAIQTQLMKHQGQPS
ncbi:MAG TPA: rod-binding protein [Rhizomicrobium sp.]|nr:rod-binding protein [Rhizomicrobium sp.]